MTSLADSRSDETDMRPTAEDRLRLHAHDPDTFAFDYDDAVSLVEELDQRRAQAVTPVAWRVEWPKEGLLEHFSNEKTARGMEAGGATVTPLYAAPPPAGVTVKAVEEIKALVVAAFNDPRLAKSNLNAAAHKLNDLIASLSAQDREE